MTRPRFTVRSLAIFVTLVCTYFGAWEATKRYALPTKLPFEAFRVTDKLARRGFSTIIIDAWSPVPFIVSCDEQIIDSYHVTENGPKPNIAGVERRHYLWLTGQRKIRLTMPQIEEWRK